ncbi:MAG: aminoacyl-tRNA hydrolase [Nitrospinota bacterium]|nr:aminoacyl-tRNA hydrolase [Nitrospinota bacterium]
MGVKLVVGLGNPGARYAFTRHNAGFIALDIFLGRMGVVMKEKREGSYFLQIGLEENRVFFLKPYKYMNLSGGPVQKAMEEVGAAGADLLVLHDDIDIKLGDARYKFGGGHGGHNGLRSIMEHLATPEFHRVRIGVGRPPVGMDASDYVLSAFPGQEEDTFLDGLDLALELLETRFLRPAAAGPGAGN